jgi:DNA-binding NarL/FixJ family response regulator
MIARRLGMVEATVKIHIRQMMRKLGASNRTQLAIGPVLATSAADDNLLAERSMQRNCAILL